MKKQITILLATALLTISANAECKPKWCNSKKLSDTESIICNDSMLRASDALLSSTYEALISYSKKKDTITKNQRSWLKNRNRFHSKSELLESYMSRISTLYNEFKMPVDGVLNPFTTSHQKIENIYRTIIENKPESLANLIKFPKTIIIDGKDTKFETKAEFIEKYPTIFTKEYRERIAKEKPTHDMFSNYQGIMLGDGIVWFTEEGNLKSLNIKKL